MSGMEETIRALREAVRLAPDNLPLRLHLARTLLEWNRADEAAAEFREALALAPDDADAKLGLARAFQANDQPSEARVVLDDLLARDEPTAAAFLLDARLLFAEGETERAGRQYRRAVDRDPELADSEWEAELFPQALPAHGAPRMPEGVGVGGSLEGGVERPKIDFASVGGMEKLKEEIRMKVIHPMEHPELFEAYGKKVGGGILLYGPPGCGKTHLARATAGEAKTGFLPVALHDVLDMWVGNSEKNLHQLFQTARTHSPCVMFFDEVDALGSKRADVLHSGIRTTVNQFLNELDGATHSNDGVLVLAATNAPWHLDSAFRRPGRFDRVLFVPPPDEQARAAIFEVMLRDKPTQGVQYDKLAKKAKGFSGADIKSVVDLAAEAKLDEAMRVGKPVPITHADLNRALGRVKPSTHEWFASARNYALYANEGGIYDDIAAYLGL